METKVISRIFSGTSNRDTNQTVVGVQSNGQRTKFKRFREMLADRIAWRRLAGENEIELIERLPRRTVQDCCRLRNTNKPILQTNQVQSANAEIRRRVEEFRGDRR